MDKVRYDKATQKWFNENPDAETTVCECEYCGLFYKPSLGHNCAKAPKFMPGGDADWDKYCRPIENLTEEELNHLEEQIKEINARGNRS